MDAASQRKEYIGKRRRPRTVPCFALREPREGRPSHMVVGVRAQGCCVLRVLGTARRTLGGFAASSLVAELVLWAYHCCCCWMWIQNVQCWPDHQWTMGINSRTASAASGTWVMLPCSCKGALHSCSMGCHPVTGMGVSDGQVLGHVLTHWLQKEGLWCCQLLGGRGGLLCKVVTP